MKRDSHKRVEHRMVRASIAGMVLLAGCRTPVPESIPSARPMIQAPERVVARVEDLRPVGDALRIATYNIQEFTDGSGDGAQRTPTVTRRQATTAAGIVTDLQADLLVVQEVENGTILKVLNDLVEPSFPLACISDFDDRGHGTKRNIAVLSRVPVLRISEIDFADAGSPHRLPRGALVFLVDLGDDHMLLGYGVHLKSNQGQRQGGDPEHIAQRTEALRVIRRHADRVREANPGKTWEIVVVGDMNIDPDLADFAGDTSLDPLADWVDLWRGRPLAERVTVPSRHGDPHLEFPSACFDRVVVCPDLEKVPWAAVRVDVLQRGVDTENVFAGAGENELHASDHYPVFVDINR